MWEAIVSGIIVAITVSLFNLWLWKRYMKFGEQIRALIADPQIREEVEKYINVGAQVKQGIQELLNDEEVQAQLGKVGDIFVEKIKMGVLGSMGGVVSGLSRQLKGAEREIIASGVEMATGLPLGDLAAEMLRKYPALKMLVPILLKGREDAVKGGLP